MTVLDHFERGEFAGKNAWPGFPFQGGGGGTSVTLKGQCHKIFDLYIFS